MKRINRLIITTMLKISKSLAGCLNVSLKLTPEITIHPSSFTTQDTNDGIRTEALPGLLWRIYLSGHK